MYRLQKNKNFKKGIEYLKSKANKNKEHAKTLGIIPSTNKNKNITDENIINYIYNIFMNKNSPYNTVFENKEEFIQNVNWNNISSFKNYNNLMLLLENEEKKEKQRKLKKLAAYNKQVISELRNEELKLDETKKKEKIKKEKEIREEKEIKKRKSVIKTKGLSFNLFKNNYEEYNKEVQLNELALTNELKYHIKMANEGEYKERFKYLFNQIQNLKTYDMKEYINSIKEDYHIYPDKSMSLLK